MQDIPGLFVGYPLTWTAQDAVLYAAAVGADPARDLDYLDLSRGPKVLPQFLGARVLRAGQEINTFAPWEFDPGASFTLSCEISIPRDVPAAAEAECVTEVVELWDKGSAAIAVTEVRVSLDGVPAGSMRVKMIVQGRGGFGGERGPQRSSPPGLDRAIEVPVSIPANAAVLYQLVGDHNPHSLDAGFAAELGFPGPISAGQVLVGAAGRTLTEAFAGGDHAALSRVAVDFAGSHIIGQPLVLKVQQESSNTFDFALMATDQPVLLAGRAELR